MKLLLRNQAYRVLSLSRFFNAFGASIFNVVFVGLSLIALLLASLNLKNEI